MEKRSLAYDLALKFAECKLQEVLLGPPKPEYEGMDHQMILYLFFEEAYVRYMNMDEKYFDFSDVEKND
ncbi:MAG: hypothetical protein IJK23_09265 [Clostridia bacterium]|nr:hypothetical protein [Clostridia bacterium]